MKFKVLKGQIEQLQPADKSGAKACRIGDSNVRMHHHLVDSIGASDLVVVAGDINNGVLQAMALKNISKQKSTQVDNIGPLLIALCCAAVGLFSLGLVAGSSRIEGATANALSLAGLAVIVIGGWFLRRFLFINDCTNAVEYYDQ